ncbi:hypothetical protein N7468_001789 [Penicillium chermesinum]|uniref:Transposase Tc1-like domain-containing protein n=1 Tax=Penicillium chermesinum TaxID=63820 RepID=A0A9W9PIX4_9EURO|nr:uncharacterized protein N7468_001789 [Penicillium chermesinum]KAJ5246806.1 hypothetical protein N7468_001789 [Penicillium chermesinum]KAJ6145069.1 hypothetical protein N7470_008964 [Penicillium chermesinum]
MPSKPILRTAILTLKAVGFTSEQTAAKLNITTSQVNSAIRKAQKKGFDLNQARTGTLVLEDEYVFDDDRSGRPRKQEDLTELILSKARIDRNCDHIAMELTAEGHSVSATTVWRVLKKNGLDKTEPTRKPGLTDENPNSTDKHPDSSVD